MNSYIIITDSSCDMSPDILFKWGIECIDLKFRKKNEPGIYSNRDMPVSEFYDAMRNGTVFQTSTINPDEYKKAYRDILDHGCDVLYLCFSSGLSATYGSAESAAKELAAEYPQRKIHVFDSLCASAGQGLLLYYAAKKRDAGATMDELITYASEIAPKICHWFTVDDLKYLKRGGRISATEAFAATVLDIKPVMHMNDLGKLEAVSKVRGRKQAIKALYENYQLLASNPEDGVYFISHGDCRDDAVLLENMIEQRYGHKAGYIGDIGSVIGSHSGPGTLALFFIGRNR
ncbi:MAG: DegV family protein [Clostridia bacterium]|nr:DegV family protein [Clostridia bacterium]